MTTIIPTTKIPCRAKDPSTCRYHSAEIRAEEVLKAGNMEAYLAAQVEMAAAINTTPEIADFFAARQNSAQKSEKQAPCWEKISVGLANDLLKEWAKGKEGAYGLRVEQDAPATHGSGPLSERELVVSIKDDKGKKHYHRFAYGAHDYAGIAVRPDSITPVKKIVIPTDQVSHYTTTTRSVPDSVSDPTHLNEIGEHLSDVSTEHLPEVTGLMSEPSSSNFYSIKNVSEADISDDLADRLQDADNVYTVTFEDLNSNLHYRTDMVRRVGETSTTPLLNEEGETVVDAVEPVYYTHTTYEAI